MMNINTIDLLQIPEVVDEINRHLWIESEKSGCNIGFEKAAEDWIARYSQGWISANSPDLENDLQTSVKVTVKKKRRAKSYY